MKRSAPMKRSRIARSNPKRKRERFARAYHSPGFVLWIRSLGCAVAGCTREDVEVAHAVSRAAGGTWEDCLALCQTHHRMSHIGGVRTFERRFGIVLADVAAATALRWKAFLA